MMKPEYQKQIIKDYPEFFEYLTEGLKIHTNDNTIETVKELIEQEHLVLPIQFGFECGDGWYWLLKQTFKIVSDYCKWNKKPFPQITQIKEKYGSLNIYHYGSDEMVDGMIWMAEHLSNHICEDCGTNVNVGKTEGWIYTICENCYNKKETAKNLNWNKI
jgi:hypothetical protein